MGSGRWAVPVTAGTEARTGESKSPRLTPRDRALVPRDGGGGERPALAPSGPQVRPERARPEMVTPARGRRRRRPPLTLAGAEGSGTSPGAEASSPTLT